MIRVCVSSVNSPATLASKTYQEHLRFIIVRFLVITFIETAGGIHMSR